jgi:DegV family protein with EDD domain
MISIVTDSTCDIPSNTLNRDNLYVVPALITIGEQTVQDGTELSRQRFYEMLPSLHRLPTTSAPSPAAFLDVYENALQKSDHVVSIHAASQLSGIYNSARLAAQEIAPERIHLIDSGQLSMGLGWAVMEALDAINLKEPLEGVLASIWGALDRVTVFALLNTVEFVGKSGRINMIQAGLTNLLNIKPIVELREGIVTSVARIRTWSRAVMTLSEKVMQLAPIEKLAVMHSNRIDGTQDLLERVKSVLPNPNLVFVTDVTTVIGTHVGPGAIGIAAISKRTR